MQNHRECEFRRKVDRVSAVDAYRYLEQGLVRNAFGNPRCKEPESEFLVSPSMT